MSRATELARGLDVKRAELAQLFKLAERRDQLDPETGKPLYEMDTKTRQEVNERNAEINQLNDQWEAARLVEVADENEAAMRGMRAPDRKLMPAYQTDHMGQPSRDPLSAFNRAAQAEGKSLGAFVAESREYKGRRTTPGGFFKVELPDLDFKTLMTRDTGYLPDRPRGSVQVDFANRTPVVGDLIPTDPTDRDQIKWMEETTFTNATTTVSEGGLKPESASVWTERTANVVKIATWIPVTEEQVDDVPGFMALIDRGLTLRLLLTEENELLNGVGPDLIGFLVKSGVQSQALSTNIPDTVYKGFTLVRWTGYAEPSGIVLHPNDWETVVLMKTTTNEYIWGKPSETGPERLWGKPVIVTNAIAEGTGLTGDFLKYSHISRKQGIRVDVANQHSTDFIYNKLAIRIEMRESLEILRAAAFVKLTGI